MRPARHFRAADARGYADYFVARLFESAIVERAVASARAADLLSPAEAEIWEGRWADSPPAPSTGVCAWAELP